VSLIPADDRVRFFDSRRLWAFLLEGEFWSITPKRGAQEHERACKRMAFMLDNAIDEQLISLRDLADGISFQELATRLPVAKLQKVVQHALECSRLDVALSEEVLLEVVPLHELIEYIPLELIWQNVILSRVAGPSGFIEGVAASSASRPPDIKVASRKSSRAAPPPPPPPAPAPVPAQASAKPPPSAPAVEDIDIEFGEAPPSAPAVDPHEAEARREVTARLEEIDRLPPNHGALSLGILHSIDSMYADLDDSLTDDEREEVIRESFPNEAQLRTAMIALIELLDPNVNTEEPVIRDAEIDALIKVVLFEERRRTDRKNGTAAAPQQTTSSVRKASRPPPLPSGPSMPPPLPGPPPLPLPKSAR
jgi:hypothetical protein